MKGSLKLFIASLIVFAASIGFFVGSVCNKPCPRGPMAMEGMNPPPPPGFEGAGHQKPGPNGHHGDFKGHKGPFQEMMDSLLQVTPEQKVALENNRAETDSIFRVLGKNKFQAEKALGAALDSEDSVAIEAAKIKVMDAHKALLDYRVTAMASLNKILTKEQREKFRAFHKENRKKFKGKGHKGPKPDHE